MVSKKFNVKEKLEVSQKVRFKLKIFQDLFNGCGMMDLEQKDCFFTRSNNRIGANNIQEMLDRALCNVD